MLNEIKCWHFWILFSKIAVLVGAHQDPWCYDGKNRTCEYKGTLKILFCQSLLPYILTLYYVL